ncbi:MAG: hypothetical protein ACI9VN_003621, partial [Patescibacteria group bacterium]
VLSAVKKELSRIFVNTRIRDFFFPLVPLRVSP